MQRLFNLNSLTDIVSNAIGIAIILALVTFITSVSRTHELVVPLAHETALTPRFFVVKNDGLWPVDRAHILREIGERGTDGPLEINFRDGGRAMVEVTDDAGFVLRPSDGHGWIPRTALASLARTGRTPFADLDREREFVFLFAYDGDWETLREARRLFSDRGVRVGWTIVTEEHPPHLCASPMSGACSYRPATP